MLFVSNVGARFRLMNPFSAELKFNFHSPPFPEDIFGPISLTSTVTGIAVPEAEDFNADGIIDLLDIDLLGLEIAAAGLNESSFDLNSDQRLNQDDITEFLGGNIIFGGNKLNGDADFSGTVDFADFLTLSANFGQDGNKWTEGDFIVNGRVDFEDFLVLSANFGQTAGSVAQVPEAHSSLLLAAGLCLIGSCRRRRHSDGHVELADFLIMSANFGNSRPKFE